MTTSGTEFTLMSGISRLDLVEARTLSPPVSIPVTAGGKLSCNAAGELIEDGSSDQVGSGVDDGCLGSLIILEFG